MDPTRRSFFASGLRRALERAAEDLRAAAADVRPPPGPRFLRPPGALDEPAFLAACTRCDACLVACPRESVRRAGPELGPALEGTPIISPALQPCWLCADLPCVAACTPGALAPLASPSEARMGTARIRAAECFAESGSPCEVCSERCPTRPKAITWSYGQGAPALDVARCTGCGVCAWLCPAQAIELSSA